MKIGLIGLGAMGFPMGRRLVEAGHALTVADISAERRQEFAAATGAAVAETAGAAAEGAEIVVTMLPTSDHVAQVLRGADGVLTHRAPGLLILEMSSGAPAKTRALAAEAEAAGVRLIDAPVSGGVPRAETGELAIMAGGDDVDVERATPILSALGTSILRTGAVGSAHAMKALNNLVSAATFLATVEALTIGARAGLDPARMVDIINVSTGMSNSSQKKMRQYVLAGKYTSGFGLDLMVKDLATAMDIADDGAVAAPFLSLCRETWARAASTFGPRQDHTALAKLVERESGVGLAATAAPAILVSIERIIASRTRIARTPSRCPARRRADRRRARRRPTGARGSPCGPRSRRRSGSAPTPARPGSHPASRPGRSP